MYDFRFHVFLFRVGGTALNASQSPKNRFDLHLQLFGRFRVKKNVEMFINALKPGYGLQFVATRVDANGTTACLQVVWALYQLPDRLHQYSVVYQSIGPVPSQKH